jgi:hypothetical protein
MWSSRRALCCSTLLHGLGLKNADEKGSNSLFRTPKMATMVARRTTTAEKILLKDIGDIE